MATSTERTRTSGVLATLGEVLAKRTDRRGFITKATLAGSALALSPGRYALRPGTAYAAICSCSGQSCDCGSACCDGYTEFCCTLTGSNSCPRGTATGGWWKADAPGLCGDAPRYYLDCNVVPPAAPCSCGCGNGSCGNRKACCTRFRYGQCHQEIAVMGPIMCRIVTCTPPWQLDASCTTDPLTDDNTRWHDAPCLHLATYPPTVQQGRWYLRSTPSEGPANAVFTYGTAGDLVVTGDWNGDGLWTPATFRGGSWYLRNANSDGPAEQVIRYGRAGDIPVVGDWDGDGRAGIGTFKDGTWYLRNTLSDGPAEHVIRYGRAGDIPVVGDWFADDVGVGIGTVV